MAMGYRQWQASTAPAMAAEQDIGRVSSAISHHSPPLRLPSQLFQYHHESASADDIGQGESHLPRTQPSGLGCIALLLIAGEEMGEMHLTRPSHCGALVLGSGRACSCVPSQHHPQALVFSVFGRQMTLECLSSCPSPATFSSPQQPSSRSVRFPGAAHPRRYSHLSIYCTW
jgi:hypothetical protein